MEAVFRLVFIVCLMKAVQLQSVYDACVQSLPKKCGLGWYRYGNMCIQLVEYDMTWNGAKTHCERESGDLLAVYNSSVHSFVINKIRSSHHYWIALNDRNSEGTFVWSIQNRQYAAQFTAWMEGEPDPHGEEDCTELIAGPNRWNDFDCDDKRRSICFKCLPEYSGIVCEEVLNRCLQHPCKNGNKCEWTGCPNSDFFRCVCIEGHEGRLCEKDCRPGPSDVLFLVDASTSENNSVRLSLDYIKHFVAKLPIGPKDFQIAVATYAYNQQLLIEFDEYKDKGNLTAAIEELEQRVYHGGPTFTYKALDWGRKLFEDSSIGVREPGPNYIKYRYIFLLTDGLSSDVLQWGSRHSSHMCSVYVLAVGSQISSTDLYDMASTGQNSFKLVFSIHNEEAFNSFWLQEMDDGCNVCNQTSFTDLLLLVDSSSNISKAQFQRTRSFIIPQLIMAFKLSHSNIKLALVSYHSEVNVLFDFTNCYTTDNIRSEVNKLLQTSQEGDTAEAIKFSKTFFTSRYGSRVNATKYVILFSNGNWSRTSDVIDAAETTKDVRLSVIVTMTPDERQNDNAGQCLDNVLL